MKRRMMFTMISLASAALAVGATFLPWWFGEMATDTDFTQLISTDIVDKIDVIYLSVAMVVFVGAGLITLGGIFASKFLNILGLIINGATVVSWFVMLGRSVEFSDIGWGIYLVGLSVVLALVTLFLPKRHRERR